MSSAEQHITARFLAMCRARPDAVAIVAEGRTWTYAELERASRSFAGRLLDLPASDDVVALYARRSGELVVGMLACLRAGLTFAVLDAGYPAERLEQMLAVLAPGRLVAIGPELVPLSLPAVPLVGEALLAEDRSDDRIDQGRPDAIAYLMFTSGTTGVPKCIATAHAPLVHFIDWYERTFAATEASRFSMLSGLGHDPVLRDVFVPLSVGAQLHVPRPATVLDPELLYAWLADERITHAHVTPQLARIVGAGRRGRAPLGSLAVVCSGGDMLRPKPASELLQVAPGARVVNFYGTTETPQAMAFHVFDPSLDTEVPIGRGIDDVELLVLDDELGLAAPGARGQIAIRTRYLSAGYRGDPALTERRYVTNPRGSDPADRLYLTGDIGHARADGAVVLDGRVDDQVKIRGFRVELGDVAAQLRKVVDDAVVLSERLPDGENRLVAYLVGEGATTQVRDAMTAAVPPYMVPGRYVWIPALPLLPNGKLDRNALVALGITEEPIAAPLDATEAAIVAGWRELLSLPRIDADSTFVDLGGDSLSFIEASVQLEGLLGKLPDGWERLTIRELARAKQAGRSRSTSIDASVLLRAISIVGVVIGHYELPNLAGTVVALFVVSGISFGKYLAPQVARTERVTPILRLIGRIAIPAILYSVLVNLFFRLPLWPGILLVNNLVSADSRVSGIGFWYIDVLVQCFVILALLLAVPPVRRVLTADPFAWLVGATLVCAGIAAAAPYVLDTSALADRVPYHFFGALFLGWALVHAETRARKLIIVAVMPIAFAQLTWESEYYLWFPYLATLFVLVVKRVSLPLPVGRLVNIVASASLFIYLTDHQVGWAFQKAHLDHHYVLMVVTAVIVGVAFWKVWDVTTTFISRRLAAAREPPDANRTT